LAYFCTIRQVYYANSDKGRKIDKSAILQCSDFVGLVNFGLPGSVFVRNYLYGSGSYSVAFKIKKKNRVNFFSVVEP
jgi:hypothetical protein